MSCVALYNLCNKVYRYITKVFHVVTTYFHYLNQKYEFVRFEIKWILSTSAITSEKIFKSSPPRLRQAIVTKIFIFSFNPPSNLITLPPCRIPSITLVRYSRIFRNIGFRHRVEIDKPLGTLSVI